MEKCEEDVWPDEITKKINWSKTNQTDNINQVQDLQQISEVS